MNTLLEEISSSSNVLVVGAYGTGNLGDEAILSGILDILKNQGLNSEQIVVLSRNPTETKEMHGVTTRRRNLDDLRKCDVAIIGGGELIQDEYNMAFKYSLLGIFLKLLGKKVIYYCIGVTKCKNVLNKILVYASLNLSDEIYVRDEGSKNNLIEMGVKKEVRVSQDPSLVLKPVSVDSYKEVLTREGINFKGNDFVIGLVVQNIPDAEVNQKLLELVPHLVDDVLKESRDVHFLFIPFNYHIDKLSDRDITFGLKVKERIDSDRFHIVMGRYSPKQILGLFQRLNFVVSTRLHPLLFATNINVDRAGIGHFRKVYSIGERYNFRVYKLNEFNDLLSTLKDKIAQFGSNDDDE